MINKIFEFSKLINVFHYFRTPIGRKTRAENYPKNMGMLKMAKRYME